ncbi:recombinase family protein [Streptacidiphilus fuscans]|uniref:Recombinase family protein n=1 Tax=Streptacidiphilus fuscans TaxID=2789292 RepID=A0A931FI87_9ACTN|nr:recombinase family protein [Streptacidiphilus fuscans]MBF9071539.1 recombinase family protein [Streptacidiphilus fuscans]
MRVSTEEQAHGYGISYTAKRVAKYVDAKGWELVASFADEGFSGSLDHTERPELRELMAQARRTPRPFDVVVVAEERAIGRRGRAFWPWVWQLEDLGIFVAVVKGDYDNTTEQGRSRMRKAQDAAEDERIVIRDRTQGGVQEKAEAGGWPGGRPPYGYRIENRGRRGESRLVLDTGGKESAHAILHRARRLLVEEQLTCSEIETLFNAEGIPGATGGPWPRGSLRKILTGQTIQESRRVFRDPANAWVQVDADGSPLFGERVEIRLDPAFSPTELRTLNEALARTADGRKPRSADAVHPLSGHVFGLCGAHYTGLVHGRSRRRSYRCSGNRLSVSGKAKCGCRSLDAEELESRIWSAVSALITDPDRLATLAEPPGETMQTGVEDEAEVRILAPRIAELETAIGVTTATTALQAVRRGLGPEAAQLVAERATGPLEEDLALLEAPRDKILERQRTAAEQRLQAGELRRLAHAAVRLLHAPTPGQLKETYGRLDLRVTVLAPRTGRRVRSDDALCSWFRSRNLDVPLLTDEAWDRLAPIFTDRRGRKPKDTPRAYVEAILTKARTGRSWSEFPGARSIWQKWSTSGMWEQLMCAVADLPGTPVATGAPVPPVRIEGSVGAWLAPADGQVAVESEPSPPGAAPFQLLLPS